MVLGPPRAAALAPQVVAPAPLGAFHDLRWLLVYQSSWITFVVEAGALLAFRTVLDAVLTRAAWPRHVALPSWREHLRRSAWFTGVQALVLFPFAVLTFAMAVTSLSWLFFVAVPVVVMVGLLVHHGAVEPRWWHRSPSRRSARALLWAFAIVTVGGALIAAVPAWSRPLVAAAVAVGVAVTRARMVHALAGRAAEPSGRRPFALIGLAGVATLVVAGTAIGFTVAVALESARAGPPRVRAGSAGPPVLVVKGFNSQWDGVTRQWVEGRFQVRRFSYRGLNGRDEPLAYGRGDTHRPLDSLVAAMRRQVQAMHRATGREVGIVAESEGALVAQAYVSSTSSAPVRALVLLSPLVEPGRVHYPPEGQEGWGVAGGTVLDGIAIGLGWIGPVDVSSDTPLFRSIVDEEPALRSLLRCPPPDVRSFAVLPLDSGVSAPAPLEIGFRHAFVPAFHGGLLGDGATQAMIRRVLRGRRAEGSGLWALGADLVSAGAAAWQAPSLVASLEPSWDRNVDDEVDETGDCGAVRAALVRRLG